MGCRLVVSAVLCLLVAAESNCQTETAQCNYGCYCGDTYVACYAIANLITVPKWNNLVQRMYIGGSTLPFISEGDFQEYRDLQELNIPANKIVFISYSAFANNKKLLTLNLGFNELTELQPKTFRHLADLQRLRLDNNQIRSIQEDTFYGLDSLTTLSLKHNNISTIPYSAMEPLGSIVFLELSGNPWECNCNIAWMRNSRALDRSDPALCASPVSLVGRDVTTLTYEELSCSVPEVTPASSVIQGYRGVEGLELECLVEGDPEPEVTWYLEGMQLSNSLHYRVSEEGNLLIVFMLPQLAGEYECVAENPAGRASAIITLEFAGSLLPTITDKPADVHVFVGSSFFLSCEANDMLTDTYQWTRNGTVLSSNTNLIIQPGVGLQVLNARRSHSGVYYCIVSNDAGSVNVSAQVDVTSTLITCDGILSPSMMEGLREKIDLAFNRTQQELQTSSKSPGSLLRRLKFPDSGIIEYLKAAEVFDQAVAMIRNQLLSNSSLNLEGTIPDLSECELEVLGQLSGCEEHQREADCSSCFHQKYRSVDGSCNNLDNPLQGAAGVPFLRLLTPAYEDVVGLPVGWSGGKPSARLISRDIISANEVTGDEEFSLMVMQIGQFLDHDIDLAPSSPSDIVFDIDNPEMLSNCADICDNDAPCFPIPVPDGDPRINRQCLAFTRSAAVCGTGASSLLLGSVGIHREQINAITSYIDGSMIYGSIEVVAGKLRELGDSGKLLEGGLTASGKRFLPFDNESLIECSTGIHANRSDCFLGGDLRTNEQVGLTSMHTIFYREHNRIVALLSGLNPHWDGERLYQEARKIVIAEWQHIVYYEYLPKILGSGYLGNYEGYDPSVDATIVNSFATAAFRFGHSQIMPMFPRLGSNYEPLPIGPLKLQNAFFSPFRLLEEGGIDPLIRGLISTPVKMRLSHQGVNNNLTEALFTQAHEIGLDLAALNIQRGRDHGLPGYNKWRSYCNLSAPSDIDGLAEHIANSTIRSMIRDIYGDDPDNIDLWVGGLLEDVLPGTLLGPTFQCIIGGQFKRLRDGDRFYYERQGQFTPDQQVQLNQASLSRVICDNADDIDHVPIDAFILQHSSEFVSCTDLPKVDLTTWQECGDCDYEQESGSRARRSALFKSPTENYENLLMKISELEEKVGTCKFNGEFYNSGESWDLSSCTKCDCQSGTVQCSDECGMP